MTGGVLVGAGPVGTQAMEAALTDQILSSCTYVVDPEEERRTTAASRLGGEPDSSVEQLRHTSDAVALATFTSRAADLLPVVEQLMILGHDVVTTCEELAAPDVNMRQSLDDLGRRTERRLVVTGANPGFAMDVLPLTLASAVRKVTAIRVERHLDTNFRRAPLVAKTGFGLSPEDFERRSAEGSIGHVGLSASVSLIASGMDWLPGPIKTTIEPVLGDTGTVIGQHQTASYRGDSGSIEMELVMASGIENPHDRLVIEGEPPLEALIPGGYHGDTGTTARVLWSVRSIHGLSPGFYRPTDLPPTLTL